MFFSFFPAKSFAWRVRPPSRSHSLWGRGGRWCSFLLLPGLASAMYSHLPPRVLPRWVPPALRAEPRCGREGDPARKRHVRKEWGGWTGGNPTRLHRSRQPHETAQKPTPRDPIEAESVNDHGHCDAGCFTGRESLSPQDRVRAAFFTHVRHNSIHPPGFALSSGGFRAEPPLRLDAEHRR